MIINTSFAKIEKLIRKSKKRRKYSSKEDLKFKKFHRVINNNNHHNFIKQKSKKEINKLRYERKKTRYKNSTPKKSTPKKSSPKKSSPKKSTPKKSSPKKSSPKKYTPKNYNKTKQKNKDWTKKVVKKELERYRQQGYLTKEQYKNYLKKLNTPKKDRKWTNRQLLRNIKRASTRTHKYINWHLEDYINKGGTLDGEGNWNGGSDDLKRYAQWLKDEAFNENIDVLMDEYYKKDGK